jgi:hypothetical protein
MYTKEEQASQIEQMKYVTSLWYYQAIRIMPQCHAFVEHMGLINEFVKVCQKTYEAGKVDFNDTNQHSSELLVMKDYNVEYLAEKLGCIYGPTLAADERLLELFIMKLTDISREKLKRIQEKRKEANEQTRG